jgi:subtilisin family serine protease
MKPATHLIPAAAIIAACIGSLTPGLNAQAAPKREVQILVKPKPSLSESALDALLSSLGARQHDSIPALDVRIIRVPQQASEKLLLALQRNQDVEYAEPDFIATAIGTANDPYFTGGNQWYLTKIQAPQAWDSSTGNSTGIVAIIDTGVRASHPDLSGKVLQGYDFINNDSDATDDNGHGTAVAGLCSAASNNGIGMAAVAWANPILPVKVLGADGSGTYSGIANGITWSADRGARIINLSLGGTSSSRTLQDAVNYAWNKKSVIIAAAGNNGNNTAFYPAACKNVVAVSATTSSDTRPSWSNYGSYVDLSAPGENILTLQGSSSYASWNGTSFSSPITSGVAALMAAANPALSNASIVDLLLKNCDDIGAAGYDVYFGNGRVNANRAVAAALATVQADTTAPTLTISSPSDGSVVSGLVGINVSATDNTGVSRIELYLDGVLFAQSNSASATFSWDTLNSTDGTHSLEARAYDAANNVGSKFISVEVRNSPVEDAIAPSVAITSPTNNSSLGRTTKISISASDNVGISKVELFIDGKLFGTSTSESSSFTWNTSKVAKGAHTLQAYAHDAAGNIGSSLLVTVYK